MASVSGRMSEIAPEATVALNAAVRLLREAAAAEQDRISAVHVEEQAPAPAPKGVGPVSEGEEFPEVEKKEAPKRATKGTRVKKDTSGS
jgi:hypothetical protein